MKILLFKGRGILSRLIRWQTRGRYSHAAVLLQYGTIIEAWHTGVRRKKVTDWTNIDIFSVPTLTPAQECYIETWLMKQVREGKKYDFLGVLRFVSRSKRDNPNRFFCSELVVEAFKFAGVHLFAPHIQGWQVSPSALEWSARLKLEGGRSKFK